MIITTVEVHFANSSSVSRSRRPLPKRKGQVPKADACERLCWFGGIISVGLSLLRRAILIDFFVDHFIIVKREPAVFVGSLFFLPYKIKRRYESYETNSI